MNGETELHESQSKQRTTGAPTPPDVHDITPPTIEGSTEEEGNNLAPSLSIVPDLTNGEDEREGNGETREVSDNIEVEVRSETEISHNSAVTTTAEGNGREGERESGESSQANVNAETSITTRRNERRVLLTILPDDRSYHVVSVHQFHRNLLMLLKSCDCSSAVLPVAFELTRQLVSEGHPYSREVYYAVAIYCSKRHNDGWMWMDEECPGVSRQLVQDLEWRCLYIDFGGQLALDSCYGQRYYRELELEEYDPLAEMLLTRYIINYRDVVPSANGMTRLVSAYHRLKSM